MKQDESVFVAGKLLRWWSAIERLQIACRYEKVSSSQLLVVLNLLADSPSYGGMRRLLLRRAANDDLGSMREPGQTPHSGTDVTTA